MTDPASASQRAVEARRAWAAHLLGPGGRRLALERARTAEEVQGALQDSQEAEESVASAQDVLAKVQSQLAALRAEQKRAADRFASLGKADLAEAEALDAETRSLDRRAERLAALETKAKAALRDCQCAARESRLAVETADDAHRAATRADEALRQRARHHMVVAARVQEGGGAGGEGPGDTAAAATSALLDQARTALRAAEARHGVALAEFQAASARLAEAQAAEDSRRERTQSRARRLEEARARVLELRAVEAQCGTDPAAWMRILGTASATLSDLPPSRAPSPPPRAGPADPTERERAARELEEARRALAEAKDRADRLELESAHAIESEAARLQAAWEARGPAPDDECVVHPESAAAADAAWDAADLLGADLRAARARAEGAGPLTALSVVRALIGGGAA